MANDMSYFEIGTPDPAASKAFYGALFDWRFGEPSMPALYAMIDENRGGLWETSYLGAENWAIFYLRVDDVCAAFDRAQTLGATVAVPVIDNGMVEFAHLADPPGNRFGIWQRKTARCQTRRQSPAPAQAANRRSPPRDRPAESDLKERENALAAPRFAPGAAMGG